MAAPKGSRRVPHQKLIEARTYAGMTPNDLAYKAGLSGKTVRMVEAGFIPGPRTQVQIAKALNMHPRDLWPFERGKQTMALAA